MSNYFDNQKNGWEWHVTDNNAEVTTDHVTHTHTLDLSKVTIGDITDNPGKTIGDAHRNTTHDYKTAEEVKVMSKDRNGFLESIRYDEATIAKINEAFRQHNTSTKSKSSINDGGRERGDEGPGNHGREGGLKGESSTGSSNSSTGPSNAPSGPSNGGNGPSGPSAGPSGGGPNGGQGGHSGH